MRAPTHFGISINGDGKWGARASINPWSRDEDSVTVDGFSGPKEAFEAVMEASRKLMLKEAEGLGGS